MLAKLKPLLNEPVAMVALCFVSLLVQPYLARIGVVYPEELVLALKTAIVGGIGLAARANLNGPVTAKEATK
jgi:hypothetical protein